MHSASPAATAGPARYTAVPCVGLDTVLLDVFLRFWTDNEPTVHTLSERGVVSGLCRREPAEHRLTGTHHTAAVEKKAPRETEKSNPSFETFLLCCDMHGRTAGGDFVICPLTPLSVRCRHSYTLEDYSI